MNNNLDEIEKSKERFLEKNDYSNDIVANDNFHGRNIELTVIGPYTDVRVCELRNLMNIFSIPYKKVFSEL